MADLLSPNRLSLLEKEEEGGPIRSLMIVKLMIFKTEEEKELKREKERARERELEQERER